MDFDVPKGRNTDGVYHFGSLRTSAFASTISGVDVVMLRPADRGASNIFRGNRIYGGSYNEMEVRRARAR